MLLNLSRSKPIKASYLSAPDNCRVGCIPKLRSSEPFASTTGGNFSCPPYISSEQRMVRGQSTYFKKGTHNLVQHVQTNHIGESSSPSEDADPLKAQKGEFHLLNAMCRDRHKISGTAPGEERNWGTKTRTHTPIDTSRVPNYTYNHGMWRTAQERWAPFPSLWQTKHHPRLMYASCKAF